MNLKLPGFKLHSGVFLGGPSGKEPACQCRRFKRLRFDSWVGKIPWKSAWQHTPVFLPGESHGQRSLVGYSPWARKSQTRLKPLSTHCFFHHVSHCFPGIVPIFPAPNLSDHPLQEAWLLVIPSGVVLKATWHGIISTISFFQE